MRTIPLTTSLTVPSPPRATIICSPGASVNCLASSIPCPIRFVKNTSYSIPDAFKTFSTSCQISIPLPVLDAGFTINCNFIDISSPYLSKNTFSRKKGMVSHSLIRFYFTTTFLKFFLPRFTTMPSPISSAV